MKSGKQEYREYITPKVLARIGGLELRARLIVEGFLSGMHHSPHRGLSVEFAEHRVYTQGDDIRHLDWKVFGRTDKYYIKQYEQETNLNVMLAVDCSESMGYRSDPEGLTKHAYATSLAAATAYLALQQQDSVGLALFDDRITEYIRPSNNAQNWKTVVHELAGQTGSPKTSIDQVCTELAERMGTQRMLVIFISDLFDDPEGITKGLRLLRFRQHDVIVWNLWDQAELTFPFKGPMLFDGLELSGELLADPGSLRARYIEEVDAFRTKLRRTCGRMHVDYRVFNTSLPLDSALSGYLATRSVRLRKRSSRVMGAG